jgi:hypothetical protein
MGINVKFAGYGNGSTVLDVTGAVQNFINNNKLCITVDVNLSGGIDPCPGIIKQFGAIYSNDDGQFSRLAVSGQDGDTVMFLPIGS